MSVTDLADFLRARYGEIRAAAAAAHAVDPGPWTADVKDDSGTAQRHDHGAGLLVAADDVALWDCEGADALCMSAPSARHAALHHPLNVIADIDSKLALLDDLLAERHHVNDGDCWYTCPAATEDRDGGETCDDNRHGKPCDCGRDAGVERRLRLLTQPFAGHPEYQEG